MDHVFHVAILRLIRCWMCRDMKVSWNTIDAERGIDAASNTVVLRCFQRIIDETHFVSTQIILNVDPNN